MLFPAHQGACMCLAACQRKPMPSTATKVVRPFCKHFQQLLLAQGAWLVSTEMLLTEQQGC